MKHENSQQAVQMPYSQEQALGEFGDVNYKPLNREARGAFEGQGGGGKNPSCYQAVINAPSQDAALAEFGGLTGGGKLSSLDSSDAGPDPLAVGEENSFNLDSPFYRRG